MRLLSSALLLALVAGCGGAAGREASGPFEAKAKDAKDAPDDDDDGPLPTDPATIAKAASVRVLQNESLTCPSEVLGPIDVHKKMESTPQALEKLKLRAAAVGADAVSNVEFEHGEGGSEPTHLSGLAVRCRDLLRGRKYDVLENITVHSPMGKEEAVFADLKRRGRELHADLIIHVKFVHGEGGEGEGLTMTGTAIRVRAE
jgi:uncharacterized protein YbjQ (UPF0145 family)